MTPETIKAVKCSKRLCDKIGPMLAGQNPTVTGMVLAELVACYFGGCPPKQRDGMMKQWAELVHQLIASNERRPGLH